MRSGADMKALALLLLICATGPAFPQDDSLRAAALNGSAAAELAYGKALEAADNDAEARLWYRKAADQNSAEAWYRLGMTTPGGAPQDIIRAAELGYLPAIREALEAALFRAGENADVDAAKRIGDLARKAKLDFGYDTAGMFATIDACYAAGTPDIVKRRRGLVLPYPNDNVGLAERYANGTGVKRNVRMAIALVCHGSGVPAELMIMVAALTTMEKNSAPSTPFRFCDYAMSGENGALCAGLAAERDGRHRATKLSQLIHDWTPVQKSALAALQKAADAYFKEHAGSEVDMSGTARGEFFIEAMTAKRDGLLKNLRSFEAGRLPSRNDFADADGLLNATYRALMARTDWSDWGTINADGIRATERLWIIYRDAWIRLGAVRYPAVSADQWRAWATRQRIAELNDLLQAP